jgi:hypothetical protein
MSLSAWQRPAWERGRFLCPDTGDLDWWLTYRREELARTARRLELAMKRGAYRGSADALARLARSVIVLRRDIREHAIERRARAGHEPTVTRCTWVAQTRALRKSVLRSLEWLGHLWSQREASAEAIRRGTRADGRPYSSRGALGSHATTVREFPERYMQSLADLAAELATVRTYEEFRAARAARARSRDKRRGQQTKRHLRLAWSRPVEGLGQGGNTA